MGPPAILSKTEEKAIVDWILEMARAGFPVTMKEVVFSVQRLLKELKRPNPFKDNCPGKSWMKGFMKRNPNISVRISQNLTRSRAVISKEHILNWFKEVETFLDQTQQKDILQDPRRIFNTDETAFFLNPKGGKVLAKKGDKTVYQQVNPDEKECLTVLVTGSASGAVPPPTVLFKYKRIPQEIAQNFPPEWGLGKTDSGWMTCEAFFEFIADIFHPWLEKEKIPLPVILFVDGHQSHLSLQVSQFCEKNGIILIALHPNATHLLQPMDVAVFRTLKEHWKKKVHEWRLSNLESPILKKKDFPKLLKEVIDTTLNATIFENGFRKCGLFPWNPEIVSVPLNNEGDQLTNVEERKRFLKEGLRFLNLSIPQSKLITFRNGDKNELDEKDMSLFELWQNTKLEIESGLINTSVINDPTKESSEDISLLLSTEASGITTLASGGINECNNKINEDNNLASENNTSTVFEESSENGTNLCQTGPSLVSAKIPSPFKRHFYYNKDQEELKKIRPAKERMPAIVSGHLCQEYFRKKLAKKEELEKIKMERAAERQKKRNDNEKTKKAKIQKCKKKTEKRVLHFDDSFDTDTDGITLDSENESQNENDGENIPKKNLKNPVQRKVGEYVVFSYEEELFPGVITHVTKTAASISAMQKCGRLWKWPQKVDLLDYNWEDVLYQINEPLKMSQTRNVYSVPELDFLWN